MYFILKEMKSNKRIWVSSILAIEFVLILINGCKKTDETSNSVTDIDGNVYKTVTIGTQTWMKENLKTTKYSNGEVIGTTIPSTLSLGSESTPKYQWAYDGNESNVAIYGRLYTWYAVTDSRNVCPMGWHVSTDADWTTLTDYLTANGYGYEGSGSDIGKSMADTTGWTTYSTAGTIGNDQSSNNSSGFTALPSGYRYETGNFYTINGAGQWWSSTVISDLTSHWLLTYMGSIIYNDSSAPKKLGFSVRCLQD